MKKLLVLLVLVCVFENTAFSQTVYDDNYKENPNYLQGTKFLANSQYTSAISEFKKALRANSDDTSSLIGLSNSYNMRAQYYNNIVKATESAISDLKSALFFLKYFHNENNFASAQTIIAVEKNLTLLEKSKKQNISAYDRYNSAKNSRIKGEFAAAAYDYYQILNDSLYSTQANVALGDIYKIFNVPKKSIGFYQTALKSEKNNSELHLKLARTYEQLNDYNSALNEYSYALNSSTEQEDILSSLEKIWQKKVDEAPKDAEAHANLGVVFQKQKRYKEALTEYQTAESLNPSNLNTKINIATLYQEQKRYDLAVSAYDNILKIQPYNVKVLIYKAECLKELKRNDDAINLYKAALKIEPNNAQVKTEMFDLLKNTMSPDEVLKYMYSNNQSISMNADSLYEFAYELHNAGKTDDAITYYLETIKLDPKKIDAYVNLSQAYRQKKDYTNANNIIQKAKSLDPANELVNKQIEILKTDLNNHSYNIALNALQSGQYQKAIEAYKKVNPPTADSLIGLAAAYQSLSDNQSAIDYYKKAMELDTKNADLPYYIASLYLNLNDINNAKVYAQTALSLNPSNSQAKEILTYVSDKEGEKILTEAVNLYDNQKYAEAITIFDKLAKTNSSNYSVYYYRALCYDALKNYTNAVQDYKLAIKYAPDMSIIYYLLAVDYDNLNNLKSAKENYKKYCDLTLEDNEYKKYAKQRLDEIK